MSHGFLCLACSWYSISGPYHPEPGLGVARQSRYILLRRANMTGHLSQPSKADGSISWALLGHIELEDG